MNAGFDAWILKPISFPRLNELMAASVDPGIRESCLYQPGEWEKGGWFHMGEVRADKVSTMPSGEPPMSNPSAGTKEAASAPDDPSAGDEAGRIPDEQQRLFETQQKERKHVHYETAEASPDNEESIETKSADE